MRILIERLSADPSYPLDLRVAITTVVPDEISQIQATVIDWVDRLQLDVVLSTGGTGFGHRDLTPEAIRPLLHREAPGIAQSLLNEGLKYTPLAVLSRPVCGTRERTLICTLPGRCGALCTITLYTMTDYVLLHYNKLY